MLNIVIFGPPGAGKGTQSLKIAETFGIKHISTGEIFRSAIRNKTDLGKKVKEVIDKGQLVPDDLVVEIIIDAIESHQDAKGFIFDGFPRTLEQARQFGNIMDEKKMPVTLVLRLRVETNELVKRLLNRAKLDGRSDDTEEVINNRLEIYRNETKPLIDFYEKKGKLLAISGIGTIDEVFVRSKAAIEEKYKK